MKSHSSGPSEGGDESYFSGTGDSPVELVPTTYHKTDSTPFSTNRHVASSIAPARIRRSNNIHSHIQDISSKGSSPTVSPQHSNGSVASNTPCTDLDQYEHDQNLYPDGMGSGRLRSGRTDRLGRSAYTPCATSWLALITTFLSMVLLGVILNSSWSHQIEEKGCRMSYMRPSYIRLRDFDTEHTRFATKYNLYLYREQGIDDEQKLRGVPVLFIPGNAGSYKQVRPIAAETANHYHDKTEGRQNTMLDQARNLDFFTVDFNEDITAFHGQTLLDQAEYLNEAIRYILSLYMDPRMSSRDMHLPDPSSVLILGHSMGGIVARTMLTMSNYQSNSINTIITLSAPHARAPVTFDGQVVNIYNGINDYWRQAYAQKWANDNPLWHVTLVSIAGGGLDTVVPSDYANIESLVPDTHGFTVFTTGIPTVWTGMDHQAILWCDQFRKVIARALYDAVDVRRSSQTRPRAERMQIFRKWFLTGMESSADKSLSPGSPTILLTLEDEMSTAVLEDSRLTLGQLGQPGQQKVHLFRVPPQPSGAEGGERFTLITNSLLVQPGEQGDVEVLFCNSLSGQLSPVSTPNPPSVNPSEGQLEPNKLLCKNAATAVVLLPSSKASAQRPSALRHDRQSQPFSYLQHDTNGLAGHEFVAVVDRSPKPTGEFLVAEFSTDSLSQIIGDASLGQLMVSGLTLKIPSKHPLVMDLILPSIQSSLIAYHLVTRGHEQCGGSNIFFPSIIRQHIAHPHESKFFVNANYASVSIHGVAPFLPHPLRQDKRGLSLQVWTDPNCNSDLEIRLTVDIIGSLGKLVLRYRTVFAAFPLLVTALVLRKQFEIFDKTGLFISFSESLDNCLRRSLPLVLTSLTFLSLCLQGSGDSTLGFSWGAARPASANYHSNDLLTGTQDPSFWFLTPLIGLTCIGVCVILHYITVALTLLLSATYGWMSCAIAWARPELQSASPTPIFVQSSPRRRMITTAILLLLVSTFIPYQFAYLVACLVQLFTTVRALRVARDVGSPSTYEFYNYAHSILLLMLWVLPINLPILAVWIRNLAVHWLTPFSSHHNVLSIMPFIILVENLTSGKMAPQARGRSRHITSTLLFGTAIFAAVYGVSYAYMLHYLVNMIAAWLVLVHAMSDGWIITGLVSLSGIPDRNRNNCIQGFKRNKTP